MEECSLAYCNLALRPALSGPGIGNSSRGELEGRKWKR